MILKGFIGGFGGNATEPKTKTADEIPVEAMTAMQNSVMREIAVKAGNRLPVTKGRDRGLPKAPPVFDLEALRAKNAEAVERMKKRSRE